jgi:hypothetical protein
MPQVSGLPANEYLLRLIQGMQSQIGSMATQQGLTVVDSKLRQRIQIGLLSNGDYGCLLSDPTTGQTTELLPIYQANILGTGTQSTSSTTYTELSTPGPTVTATIGQSGNALLTCNAYMGLSATVGGTATGIVGISVDSAAPTGSLNDLLYYSVTVPAGTAAGWGFAANQSAQIVVTGLTPGQHTFQMQYKVVGANPVNFGSCFLQVRPL